jgi:hypothetical protein
MNLIQRIDKDVRVVKLISGAGNDIDTAESNFNQAVKALLELDPEGARPLFPVDTKSQLVGHRLTQQWSYTEKVKG